MTDDVEQMLAAAQANVANHDRSHLAPGTGEAARDALVARLTELCLVQRRDLSLAVKTLERLLRLTLQLTNRIDAIEQRQRLQ